MSSIPVSAFCYALVVLAQQDDREETALALAEDQRLKMNIAELESPIFQTLSDC